jgi:hypothetical protein
MMTVTRLLAAASLIVSVLAPAAQARPTRTAERPAMPFEPPAHAPAAAKAAADTFWFGGTHWDAAQARWEANVSTSRTNRWTFDSGVDNNLEGWWGFDDTEIPLPTCPRPPVGTPDNSDFRWTHEHLYSLYGTPGTDLFPNAAPPDTGAIWCSKYEVEADELCYVGGQGHGSRWHHEATKTFAYGGSGDVRLTFKYFNTTEKNYDFTFLYLEFDGVRESLPRVTMTYTLGSPISKRTNTLTVSAASIPAGTTQITSVFRFTSDSGWSDEDGVGFTTVYGGFACYSFGYEDLGTPGNNDEDSFEESPEGWTFRQPAGVGSFVGIQNISNLPPPETTCPCTGTVLQGNVLTQCDAQGQHPDGQDAFAMSPLIDLDEAGLGGVPVKMVFGDAYIDQPLDNAVYFEVWLRQYPVLCEATGQFIEDFVSSGYAITIPLVNTCLDDVIFEDFSLTAADIDYCYIAIEVLSLCSVSTECMNPGGNSTPWWDNMALVVTGTAGAPRVGATEIRPFLQDIFAADGSLRPKSTCVLDGSGDANFGTSVSDADLEDTMYVNAAGTGVQVDLWFRYQKGPGTGSSNLFFSRYPAESTWYSARCDSGRSSAGETWYTWCSEYHEASPYFSGENAEANEILPDRVFTPGSHIEYYWSANHLAAPGLKHCWPDVPSGDQPLSVDLLPGMWATATGDTMWPCTLYINGESRQPLRASSPYHMIEPALDLALAGAMGNPHPFDRYDDVLTGSNTNASFARQVTGDNGMTDLQSLGYWTIIGVYGSSKTYTISNEDGQLLSFWLSTTAGGANEHRQLLYFSGEGLAVDMSNPLRPQATNLLNNYFGVQLACSPYREAGCPTGSVADTSFCVQLSPAAGADPDFVFSGSPYRAEGNGCPSRRRFSVLHVNAAVPTAKPNLDYVDQDGPKGTTHYASVTNDRAGEGNGDYRTVFDGVGLSRFRRPAAAGWECTRDSLAIVDRLRDVVTWGFAQSPTPLSLCGPYQSIDVEDDPAAVPRVNSLTVSPNPFNPLVRLRYALAAPGKVTLRIFDVQGVLVKTLVDETKTTGRYEALWNGTDDGSRRMASGVFWARYEAPGSGIVKQLVLLK